MRQAGLFGLSEHLKRLSAHGDPLEALGRIIDFEAFRPMLVAALAKTSAWERRANQRLQRADRR